MHARFDAQCMMIVVCGRKNTSVLSPTHVAAMPKPITRSMDSYVAHTCMYKNHPMTLENGSNFHDYSDIDSAGRSQPLHCDR